MKRKLIIIGGGGHCRSVIDVAECAGYEIVGILDGFKPSGDSVLGYPIVGSDNDIPQYVNEAEFIVAVGHVKDVTAREYLHRLVLDAGGRFATIVSPLAHVSKYARIGEGTVVMHRAIVNANAQVGNGCIINTASNIEHDVVVGNLTHVSTGAMVNGGCVIGDRVMIGSGAVILQSMTIEHECVIGAGAVVTAPIEERGIYAGVPARLIKKLGD